MKNTIIATLSITALLTFSGCDYIDAPYTVEGPNGCTVTQPDFTPRTNPKRKVLVEEFTGHRCGNCPRGAETIATMEGTYGEQVIAIAHHTYNIDYFTAPLPADTNLNPEQHYLYDFRSQESLQIDNKYGVASIGVPTGLVNRRDFGSGYVMSYTSWNSRVATALADAPVMDIQLKAYWTPGENTVCAFYFVEVLQNTSGNFKLALYITESDIVQWQKDYNASPNDIELYHHKHIMRKAINGVNGTSLTSVTSLTDGETFTDGYAVVIDPAKWDVNNLHIIGFVYNDDTDEIIQAEEVKLIP